MGKKVKLGKFRKDKFYQLAKESGYRSRAAFKLLQLNRTYHFLEKSHICIDLCAAPGGWLQVAQTHMPVSSIIIGIDLAPIKPISNVITHVEDITTANCRQLLKKDLNDQKADVVLHDGAPNVGKNWLHDAYQQNILVLQSFKLASEFLRKGGYFVTKVFRSKDYYSLLWVLQKFFKKVESTKPQASRNESAEIFIVCQNYLAPEQIDPKFLDIKYVFNDVELDTDSHKKLSIQDLFKPAKRNRGGYPEGDMTLHHKLNASLFILSDNYMELLANASEIVIDEDKIDKHAETTNEIKECFKDIKLLGKQDLKNILKWRLKLKEIYDDGNKKNGKKDDSKSSDEESSEEDESDKDDLDKQVFSALDREKRAEKRKRRKLMKEKRKLRDRLALKMEFPENNFDFELQGDNQLFNLTKIKTKKQLMELQNALPGLEISSEEEEDADGVLIENGLPNRYKQKASYMKDEEEYLLNDNENGTIKDLEINKELFSDSDSNDEELSDENNDEENPLLQSLTKGNKKKSQADLWFKKDAFNFMNNEDDDIEFLKDIDDDRTDLIKKNKKRKSKNDSSSDDDSEEENKLNEKQKIKAKKSKQNDEDLDDKKGFEIVPENKSLLTAHELALGEMIVNSKKKRSELIDDAYNRYSGFGDYDENMPKWFIEDEKMHYQKVIPVPKEVLERHKKKFEDINVRPIKKVVEAQARKKRRMSKKLEKARKKSEKITDNPDMTQKERNKEIKQVFKRAGLIGKKKAEVKYVVARKNNGRRGANTKGIKGPYRVVDKRLKKDKKAMKKQSKSKKKFKK